MVSVEKARQDLASAQAELDDSIKHGRSDVAYRRQAVADARVALDEALLARQAAREAADRDGTLRSATFQGTVVELVDASSVRVSVEGGAPSHARLGSGITRVEQGDRVEVVKTGGVWQVTNVLTQHSTPVVDSSGTAIPSPPSPTAVPPAPGSAGSVATVQVPDLSDPYVEFTSTSGAELLGYIRILGFRLNSVRSGMAEMNLTWRPVINQAAVNAVNGVSYSRTNAQAVNNMGGYAEDVGEAASSSSKGITNAAAQAGVVSKVPRWSLSGLPPITGGPWAEQRASVKKALDQRVSEISKAWSTLAQICTYLKVTGPGAMPAAPSTNLPATWSGSGSMIQAVDDWANARILALRARVAAVRATLGLAAVSWRGVVYAWSDTGTSEGSTAGFKAAASSFQDGLSQLGTAMSEISKAINEDPNR